jgi:3-methyladenine DNA glycosylase AlkD
VTRIAAIAQEAAPLRHVCSRHPGGRQGHHPPAPELTHDELDALVDALWVVLVHERRIPSVELLDIYCDGSARATPRSWKRLLRGSRTWALVDGLAGSVVGRLFERHPELSAMLDRWAADGDFWLRRSAMLALLISLREGRGDFDRFRHYADAMPSEREFFIRKAIGWVLRDTGRRRPNAVYEWLLPRATPGSAVTIRDAVKPLSAVHRAAIVAAR